MMTGFGKKGNTERNEPATIYIIFKGLTMEKRTKLYTYIGRTLGLGIIRYVHANNHDNRLRRLFYSRNRRDKQQIDRHAVEMPIRLT